MYEVHTHSMIPPITPVHVPVKNGREQTNNSTDACDGSDSVCDDHIACGFQVPWMRVIWHSFLSSHHGYIYVQQLIQLPSSTVSYVLLLAPFTDR